MLDVDDDLVARQMRWQGAMATPRSRGPTRLPLLLRLGSSILRRLALGDRLLQVLQSELKLVRTQLLRPTTEPVAQKPLDQQPKFIILGLAFLRGTLQCRTLQNRGGDHVAQHLLQDGKVVRQGGEIDLHASMMEDAAAPTPPFCVRSRQLFVPPAPACGEAVAPATRIRQAVPPAGR